MRPSPLLSSLTLGLLLLVPPVYGVNYTGEAVLDWNTLQFSGIPIAENSSKEELLFTRAYSNLNQPVYNQKSFDQTFGNWPAQASAMASVPSATAVSSIDPSRLSSSVTLSGPGGGQAYLVRDEDFTAKGTGNLTVSIDYTLRQVGSQSLLAQNPQGASQAEPASVYLGVHDGGFRGIFLPGETTAAVLPSGSGRQGFILEDGIQTGTLRITEPFQSGQNGYFEVGTSLGAESGNVPVPDMLWPTLVGMIGIAFWGEWRRRQTRFTK